MAVTEKYQSLIDLANQRGVGNLQIAEQDGVLYVTGTATGGDVKNALWDEYNRIDPDYRSGDLVLNIEVAGGGFEEYIVVSGDSLSKIASHWGVHWKQIWDANRDTVKNPNLIHPGQKLKIPR
jgi:nucleoid-associated protein YgaU